MAPRHFWYLVETVTPPENTKPKLSAREIEELKQWMNEDVATSSPD